MAKEKSNLIKNLKLTKPKSMEYFVGKKQMIKEKTIVVYFRLFMHKIPVM